MAESYSVKAILSAQDKGFTSAFKSAMSSANSLKNTLTSGLGFGIMAGIGQKALGTITSGIGGMVSELNSSSAAWKTFNGNMSMLGKGADEISSVKKELQEFAEDTIYSASDMASTYAQLSAVGIKSTNKLVKGFGGLAAAAENPKQAMKTLSQQATQMAAKPTVAWADFKLMIEQTPAGIAAVAKEMGMSTTELVQNVQAGTIATEDFFDAIAKVGTNDAFTKLATEYKTVDQAMDGLTETVSNKLAPSFDILSGRAIKSLDGIINKFGEMDGDAIAGKLTSFLDKASGYWNVLKTEASEVKTAFGDAFSAIGRDLGKVTGAFGSTESISSFAGVMDSASGALQTFAGFLEDHSETIAKVIPQIPKLVVAYKGFKIVKSVAPFVGVFTSAIAGLAGAGISKIAGKLFGISKGQEAVGKSSSSSSKKMIASAKSFMMLGAGVALISGGFFLLAQGAKAVADSGPLAVGVLAGLVAVVAGLGLGMMKMLSTMSGGTKKLAVMSKAMIAFGASLLMVSAAFYVLSSAAINLASAGPLAIGVMVGMVAAIGALMVVAAAVGPALTAASIGLVAFGAAALLVGVGALLAGAALAIVAAVLPIVTAYGTEGATAILQLSLAMMAFAAGATLAGAGSIILGAGLMVVGAGLALVGTAVIVTAAGMMLLAAGTLVLGAGLSLVASSIMIVAVALPLVAAGALLGVAGFTALMAVSVALGASMLLLTTSFALLAALSLAATVGIAAFGVAMLAGSVGTLAMAAALLSVNSSMKSISKNAKSAQKSITSMKDSVSIVNDGLDALGNKAKSAVNSLVSAFNDGAGRARNAGQKMGDGVKDGVTKGLQPLPNIANQTMSRFNSALSSGASRAIATANMMSASIVSALNTASSGAYNSGYNIGIGLANGMAATLGYVQSVASQLAAAADAAVRAKAKIHSPSRVFMQLGSYIGEGFAAGISATEGLVRKNSEDMVAIPNVNHLSDLTIDKYRTGRAELSSEYSYRENTTYEIVVVSELDGKEIAKATAVYTQDELEKLEKRKMRRQGYRNV